MTQTWWLSFCDPARPEGAQFLGAAVLDVTEADVATARPLGDALRARHGRPPLTDGDAWFNAAIAKAQRAGCHPAGECAAMRLDLTPGFSVMGPLYPRDRLLSMEQLATIGAVQAFPIGSSTGG